MFFLNIYMITGSIASSRIFFDCFELLIIIAIVLVDMYIIDDYRSGHNSEFTHAILKLGHLLIIICVIVLVLLSGKTGRHLDELREAPPKVLSESVTAVKIWVLSKPPLGTVVGLIYS